MFPLVAFLVRTLMPQAVFAAGFESEERYLRPLVEAIEAHTDRSGRVAFMDASPGALSAAKLRHYCEREFIGGPFSQMNLLHSYAAFTPTRFFDRSLAELSAGDVRTFARDFNIRWIVTTSDEAVAVFRQFEELLRPLAELTLRWSPRLAPAPSQSPFARYVRPANEMPIAIFEVLGEASFFLRGSGELRPDLNRIEVRGAAPGETVLKYHWLPTLRVDPPLPIRMYRLERSPIGFIAVTNGDVRDFTVYDAYAWPDR